MQVKAGKYSGRNRCFLTKADKMSRRLIPQCAQSGFANLGKSSMPELLSPS
jgi:hypothetical protein